MSTHNCPAPGCTEQVKRSMLACKPHWFMVPRELRRELKRTYQLGNAGRDEHMDAIIAITDWFASDDYEAAQEEYLGG